MSDALWRPSASAQTLVLRASLRDAIRQHFAENALEVEVPICQAGPNRDHSVEPAALPALKRWLVTSPEHPLKRLIAADYGAVWSLTPCVRLGESGRLHRPEFTMLEWYRPGWGLDQLLFECVELLRTLLQKPLPLAELSWAEAMQLILPHNPYEMATTDILAQCPELPADCGREECLEYIFGDKVQPLLGKDGITVVTRWPASACAQAKVETDQSGEAFAARFELFVDGIELANAYDECWDAAELRARFVQDAAERRELSPIHDQRFLTSLQQDPGQVSGVAMGFDRIVMLAADLSDIGDAMAFSWESA